MSLPMAEPKVSNLIELDRAQYGRYAMETTLAVTSPRKYEVFSVLFPESLRVIKTLDAA